jgi:hypothetical protein
MATLTSSLGVLFSILLCSPVWAATTTVNCSSASTVQTALNNASSGDTVRCTGSGWTGTVTIPNNKNITLDGGGVSVSGGLSIPSSPTFQARVTNFTFTSTARYAISTGLGYTNKPWRFDHCIFGGGSQAIMGLGSGPGLIDHLTALSMGSFQQMIELPFNGPDSTAGWTTPHTPGSPNAIYIEDSNFAHPGGNIWDGSNVIQEYYGARVVARYNNINAAQLEVHGSEGAIGGRWWEFYNNRLTNGGICIRAGSGVIFNNTGSTAYFVMLEEDSGYPALYQVGRGQNQILFPAYVWGNTLPPGLNQGGMCSNASPNMVQLNRDVYIPSSGTTLPATCSVGQGFWKTDEGGDWDTTNGTAQDGALYKCTSTNSWTLYYTPYTYPHPLQQGGGPGLTSPAAPTNLKIIR